MGRLHLTLLGGVDGRLSSGSSLDAAPHGLAVLAYLALAPRGASDRDALAALLWGDTPETQAQQNLTDTLSALDRALTNAGDPVLVVGGHSVALDLEAVEVDVHLFERCLAETAPAAWASAAALYRGDLLQGFDVGAATFAAWLIGERQRLRGLAIGALESLLAHEVHQGASRSRVARERAAGSRSPRSSGAAPRTRATGHCGRSHRCFGVLVRATSCSWKITP